MSAAPIVIIINRPRPRQNASQPDTFEMQILGDDSESVAQLLRRAADQLDAGPGTGEA